MPKADPIGSPMMKARSIVKDATSGKAARADTIRIALGQIKETAKVKLKIKGEEDMAYILGVSHPHYRRIKDNPMLVTIDEIRAIRALAGMLGMSVDLGLEVESHE